MEERRTNERMAALEAALKLHLAEHAKFEQAMTETAEMTRQLVENTREIVDLVKGAKGFRSFILWLTPVVAAVYAIYVWAKS